MTNAIRLAQMTDDVPKLIRSLQLGETLRVFYTQRKYAGIVNAAYVARKVTGNNYTVRNLPTLECADVTRY